MTDGAEAARPGTSYFAPAVRVRPMPALTRADRDDCEGCTRAPSAPPPQPSADALDLLAADIISIEVTQVANGSGTYTIVLNNEYDTLPADRSERRAGLSETLPENGIPETPRFKYNDFAIFNFGTRLRIDMGYWPAEEGTSSRGGLDRPVDYWVPMIAGPITDMRFTFSSSEGSRLTITGEDDLALFKEKNCHRVSFSRRNEREIVERVVRLATHDLPLVDTETWPAFATRGSSGISETFAEGQSYLEFLQKIAQRIDFEIFVEFEDPTRPSSRVRLHFERSRSRVVGTTQISGIHVFERGKNLLELTPTIKVHDQYTEVKVTGRHRDITRPERLDRRAQASVLADELHREAGDPELDPGPTVRQNLLGGNCHTESNRTNLDDERAEELAGALLRQKAREFMTIRASTIGLPRLRPGSHIQISKMRTPFDGFYYVEKAVHRYGGQGYRTEIEARRPGMPRASRGRPAE